MKICVMLTRKRLLVCKIIFKKNPPSNLSPGIDSILITINPIPMARVGRPGPIVP